MKKLRILSLLLILAGITHILFTGQGITGAFGGVGKSPHFIGAALLIVGIISLLALDSKKYIGLVKGRNPITENEPHSPLYREINTENLHEIFQTPLAHKFGEGVMGAKAIVYMDYAGKYHAVFLTEAIDTHHRHAAATIARLIDGVRLEDPSYLNEQADTLYEGDSAKSCDLLTKCGGFELQYDTNTKKIIGIKQDSWVTKEQKRCNRYLTDEIEESMIIELICSIDVKFLPKDIEDLEDKTIKSIKRQK